MSESWICQHCGHFNYSYRSADKSTTVTRCTTKNCNLSMRLALRSPQTYRLSAITFLVEHQYVYICRAIREQKGACLIQLAQITVIQNLSHVTYCLLRKDKSLDPQQQFVFSGADIAEIKDLDCIRLKDGTEISKVEQTQELRYAASIPFYSNMYFHCGWHKPFRNKLEVFCAAYCGHRMPSSIIELICNSCYAHSIQAFNCPLFYWFSPKSTSRRRRGIESPQIELKLLSSFLNLSHLRTAKDEQACAELQEFGMGGLQLYPDWTDEDIHSCFEVLFIKHESLNLEPIEKIDEQLVTHLLSEVKRNKTHVETALGVHFGRWRNTDLEEVQVRVLEVDAEEMSTIAWLRHQDFFQTYQSYQEESMDEDGEMVTKEDFMSEADLEKNNAIKVKQVVKDEVQPFFRQHFVDSKVVVLEKGTTLTVLILGVTKDGQLAGYTGMCRD